MKKIIIDVYDINPENDFLIAKHKTGVFYTSQCGGIGCTHPEFEGYIIKELDVEFDDCKLGCCEIGIDKKITENAAKEINKYLIELTSNWNFKLHFDYNCINELQEACWPVIINMQKDYFTEFELVNAKGILFGSNCD